MSSDEHDASVFVYLSEIDVNGRSWFITEGCLRLLHRIEASPPQATK